MLPNVGLMRFPKNTANRSLLVVKSLFVNGEQGAWYDPSDFATLFQDASGTTPVTAVGQPVGLMLDKRLGLGLGSELWTDSSVAFTGGSSRVSPGVYRIFTSAGAFSDAHIVGGLTVGKTYQVSFTVDSIASVGGGIVPDFTNAVAITTTGIKTFRLVASTTTISIKRADIALTDYQISNVSVKLLDGNHASQVTTANRPVLQQDAGGHYYLAFNGTNSSMSTVAINFTATDKMTVVAGVRKLSDVATAILAELSVNLNLNNGTFFVTAPTGAGLATYGNISKGTASAQALGSGFTAPHTAVLSHSMNIAAPNVTMRVNQTPFTSTVTQGTGNYGNYPLYIGARAGTSLFFNGNLYSLIVRGAASSASQIQALEAYANSKTGAY